MKVEYVIESKTGKFGDWHYVGSSESREEIEDRFQYICFNPYPLENPLRIVKREVIASYNPS